MQVELRIAPHDVDGDVSAQVVEDVTAALKSVTTQGDQFVVNDTLWYGRNRQGKATLQVVNSAAFISQRFENFLHDARGWDKQKILDGQRIDGYIELHGEPGYSLDKQNFAGFLDLYIETHPEASIDDIFFRYVRRQCFSLARLDPRYHSFLRRVETPSTFRVGLEFETGNIASSFRALNKLNVLFRKGEIDAGVFITSRDKATTSTRIWPSSNRNGSFEELENRNFRETVTIPMWELSFAPDRIDGTAPYLAAAGVTYHPVDTGERVSIGGYEYEMWTGDGKELLRRVS